MKIHVSYTGQLKNTLGLATDSYWVDGAPTLRELLDRVVERHGDGARSFLLCADRQPQPSLLLLVNDAQVSRTAGEVALTDGDRVTLMAPFSGG